jgi:hypothetical protein
VTTPYVFEGGELVAVVPERGPCWRADAPCAISLDHKRRRKTGPPFGWVAVMRCSEHRLAFTAYPAGHVPYGRVPVVALAPDGSELADRGASLFDAAADARTATRWPREGAPDDGAVATTQRRRLEEAATLLGLGVGATTPATAAAVLHVAEGRLVEVARRLSESRDLATLGREVTAVMGILARRGGLWLMDRFALLGHLAGWWGRPWRWIPRPPRLLALGEAFWRRTRGREPP